MSRRILSIVSFGAGLEVEAMDAAPAPANTIATKRTPPPAISAAAQSGTTRDRAKTAADDEES
jgi:hypothetical protein